MSLNGALGLGFVVSAKDSTQAAWRSIRQGMADVRRDARMTMQDVAKVGQAAAGAAKFAGRYYQQNGHFGTEGALRRMNAGGGVYRDAGGRMRSGNGRFVAGPSGSRRGGGAGGGFGFDLGRFVSGGAIMGGLTSMVGAAASFEKEMAAVRAISGASATDFERLKKAAFGMFKEGFSPLEAAKGLQDLASAGYNAKDSIALLKPTMLLAAASMGDLSGNKAAGLLSASLKAFQLDVKDSARVVDILANTADTFSVQYKDLPLGLANVSRGAISMGQDMTEAMVAFGLARNIIPRVESAATAVSRSMERMVNPKVQQSLKGLGVNVTTADGKFRSFLDIVQDMQGPLNKMTDSKRAAFLQKTFGASSLAGFNAVVQQIGKGMTDTNGKFRKGAELVAHLRKSLGEAGKAQKFKDIMLDTLTGQASRLKNTGEAFGIALAGPIAGVLKPLTKMIADNFDGVVDHLSKSSKEVRGAIGGIVVGIGAGLASLLLFGGPATLVLAGIATGILGIKAAVDANIGGVGDKFFALVDKIKLGFKGALQLFSNGGFSGEVRNELNKTENGGLKQFLITAFVWVERVKNFFRGLGAGLSRGLEAAQPAFDAFSNAIGRVAKALGLTSDNDPTSNTAKWEKWGSIGERVGNGIAGALEFLANAMTRVIEFGEGFFGKWDGASTTFNGVKDAVTNVASALGLLKTPSPDEKATSGWRTLGSVLGWISNFALTGMANSLRSVSQLLAGTIDVIGGLGGIVAGVFTGNWQRAWNGVKDVVFGVVRAIVASLGFLVDKIAGGVDAIFEMGGKKTNFRAGASKLFQDAHKELGALDLQRPGERRGTTFVRTPEEDIAAERSRQRAQMAMFAGATAASVGLYGFGGVAAGLGVAKSPGATTSFSPTINVKPIIQMDGQQIAYQVLSIQQENHHRSGGNDGLSDD